MNTIEARVAFVNSQAAAMLAELEGMKAENVYRERRGESQAYAEQAFFDLIDKYQLGHNSVLNILRGEQR